MAVTGVGGANPNNPVLDPHVPTMPDNTGVDFGNFFSQMQQQNMEMLQNQEMVQQESRRYNMVSNVMKTKHDNVMNSIRNMK
ncbi:MAG: hypothetical protein HYV63_31270 [Candidatus Schekmanbacteria bacterium]|nr:hypothetical protein [Candidatus Schekmanbacteria bacterium]